MTNIKNDYIRQEYPRPDFERENWISLNGIWDFAFDDSGEGEQQNWYQSHEYTDKIIVPFCYQSKNSGIGDTACHPYLWYHRNFDIRKEEGRHYLLKFGAVDYHTKVWINDQYVGEHYGGHSSFQFDISTCVRDGSNSLTVRVVDTNSCDYPRGKQFWGEEPERCWYTQTSGIWQNVWLEITGDSYFDSLQVLTDIDHKIVDIHTHWVGNRSKNISCRILYEGRVLAASEQEQEPGNTDFCFHIKESDPIEEFHYWSPEHPQLFDLEITICSGGHCEDRVKSYFGMRKISIENGKILLNNKPYYQKLIMDQGYWVDGLMTAPSDESFYQDLKIVKEMGFNGVRKHQKIEDPRFYYWADRLGLLVWEEMPSAYVFSAEAVANTTREWIEILRRDWNHPCVIAWVTLNESWGVRNIISSEQQQNYAAMLYYLTKSMDPSRIVSSNDGWEQICFTDLCSIHDYEVGPEELEEKYGNVELMLNKDAQGRMLYAHGHRWLHQPVILSEFGGAATISDYSHGWGYKETQITAQELMDQYQKLIHAISRVKTLQGFCYTQLTDVMQEVNGLLDAQHKPKVSVEKIREYNAVI